MLFSIPWAIWFGIFTIISLFATFSLGIAMKRFKKPVFKYHKMFAFLTVLLAAVHLILSYLLWFLGISI